MVAQVYPAAATSKAVTWSVANGTVRASIKADGILTGLSAGTVAVTAMAADGSGVRGSIVMTVRKR